jgi:Lipase (class 3)
MMLAACYSRKYRSLWIIVGLFVLLDVPTPTNAFMKSLQQFLQKAISGTSTSSSTATSEAANDVTEPEASSTTFSFSQELLQLTYKAIHLSNLAYDDDPLSSTWDFPYEFIDAFNEEVDQAVLVKIEDYCMVAFRGTDLTSWYDMYQNVMLGNTPVCDTNSGACCNAENGFYDAYNRGYRNELENKIRFCSSQCKQDTTNTETVTKCPTVVLTGHSQGGSIATIAAIVLSDLSPIVITFGQPPTIDASCPLLDGNSIYRFVNSRIGRRGTTYDPVPYLPYRASQYGHQIMLGDDTTRVAYIGQSPGIEFQPWDSENFFETHRLTSNSVGYLDRIDSLVTANANAAVIPSSGFQDGSACTNGSECDSEICFVERCVRA